MWIVTAAGVVAAVGTTLWVVRTTRQAIRHWFRRAVLRAVHQFEVRLERHKLVNRHAIREELLRDAVIEDAIREFCREHNTPERKARARVSAYIDEIVPFFNVLSYYRFGYNVSRVLANMLYRVTSTYQDREALNAIPRNDVVVYLMNHRSNADYVIVAYVLARGVSISYAVGEWARTWPLEYIFKSFGSYFIRRRYRERLYHTVLERYVQSITRNGVTQGIFLEGGLSRDGALRPAKIGLLDHIARTVTDPAFTRDIWLVPVGLNYDRVLEDRTLIRELVDPAARPGRLRQFTNVLQYLGWNALRLLTGNLRRYGRVAVNFGTPLSVREWERSQGHVLALPREERLPHVQRLADHALDRIGAVIPVTSVPLVSAALLSFGETLVGRADLLDRIDDYQTHLRDRDAKLVHADYGAEETLDRAWRTFRMRRLVAREGGGFLILPTQRPLLEYYANSIRHLLPRRQRVSEPHPARDEDDSLPRLRAWTPPPNRGSRA
ncbi:MAG TPA: 1-acyl-sn-glycerol-3-phosphate acyltransferase [Gemmatimonadales bacterium]